MELKASELPRTCFIKQLENSPETVEIDASESECSAIAERLGINTLVSLSGQITLAMPSERESMINAMLFDGPVIMAEATLRAIVTQTCVVTLEPFETTIEASFTGVFSNEDPTENLDEDDEDGASHLPDVLGPIGDEVIDLGEVFIEQLALEIDPFPRKPDAKFDGFSTNSDETEDIKATNPFAVLEKLKENLE